MSDKHDASGEHGASVKATSSLIKTVLLVLAILLTIAQLKSCWTKHKEMAKVAEAEASKNAAAYDAAHPHAPASSLVLLDKCVTPCYPNVGWSNFVHTDDGCPIRVKYNGCTEWTEIRGKANVPAPKCFRPGPAQVVSGDTNNPDILVRVYKER